MCVNVVTEPVSVCSQPVCACVRDSSTATDRFKLIWTNWLLLFLALWMHACSEHYSCVCGPFISVEEAGVGKWGENARLRFSGKGKGKISLCFVYILMNNLIKIYLIFHHHFCVGFDMWYKRLYAHTVSSSLSKRWCNMDWCVGCGMEYDVERGRVWAVGWDVERCVMWNESVECGLWHGMWNVV